MVSKKKGKRPKDEVVTEAPGEAAPQPTAEGLAEREAAEPSTLEEGEESAAPTPEQVIEALSAELEALEDRHLRLVAEFDNFRKRTIKERAVGAQRAQAELVKQLLESLDDLARVSDLGSTDHDAAAILEGVQLVERKLLRALEQQGLRRIEAVGRPFDPEIHEAMVTVATDHPEEDETVSQELAKGYMFGDALLRPSAVEVKIYRAEVGDEVDASEDRS
ncbi:MAG: nucleotide exchange factor GrpE [Gemmatimonadota bacterium]|nr:MAG: nucleotide exchange factor GrpE [Gemmatimonadota bacterium]